MESIVAVVSTMAMVMVMAMAMELQSGNHSNGPGKRGEEEGVGN